MAASIGISEFTLQDYVRSAIRKLDAFNRVQGVAEALGKWVARSGNQKFVMDKNSKSTHLIKRKQKEI